MPWRFTNLALVPPDAFKNKAHRDEWINRPGTAFNVYTLYEGTQGNLRLRGSHSGQDDNPPLLMYGLAVDYDTAMSVSDVIRALPMMEDTPPNWFEQTLSGNGRLIWLFERPLRIPSRQFLLRVLERIHDLIPFRKLPGLDEGALKPERCFTNGCRWTAISRQKFPYARLQGFLLRISEKFDWQQKEFGRAVNLKDVFVECKKNWPDMKWPGEFVVGATGPSFWVPGSTSPKSAIIRETGIQTFAAHASKAFYSWSEIVGAKFVENNENERLGKAVEGVFHDGRNFIIKDGEGRFAFHTRENIKTILTCHRGVKSTGPKGEPSEIERALAHILQYNVVVGASSCAFFPKGPFVYQGRRILNTHQLDVTAPVSEPSPWGESGRFPFLSKFLDGFFDPVFPQKERFLAWFQYHYRACLNRAPVSGHGMFIAGPVGVGKTFLSRGVVGGALGGFGEANSYLTASDGFNSELFDYGLWVIDDGSVMSSEKIHQLFTENVKRTVANRDHRVNEKFRKATMTPWQGRILVTLNMDAKSIRIIPNVDASILEKLLILRAAQTTGVQFLAQPDMEKLLERELPWFLRWLLDWTPPGHCYEGADVRFGIAPYAEPSLLRAANLSSGKSVFVEILTRWLTDYFNETPRADYWEGTATELRMAMMTQPVYGEMLRPYRPEELPRMLVTTMNQGLLKIEVTDDDEVGRRFRIYRGAGMKKPFASSVEQTENSQFQKP